MTKNAITALVTAALIAGVATPSFAATTATSDESDKSYLTDEVANDYKLIRLQEQGIKATSIDEWNGLLRAFVTLEDGKQAMRFFDPDTLAPVQL